MWHHCRDNVHHINHVKALKFKKKSDCTTILGKSLQHYNDVIMGSMASQITSLTIVHSAVYSDKKKHQSSASLAFVRGIHWGPVNSPHKWPVTRKMFPFGDVIVNRRLAPPEGYRRFVILTGHHIKDQLIAGRLKKKKQIKNYEQQN